MTQNALTWSPLPPSAAWRHHDLRQGFEVVHLAAVGAGHRLEGHVTAVEEGAAWAVRYEIVVDHRWCAATARVWSWSELGERTRTLTVDRAGRWAVDGGDAAELDGCRDVDLEASACTNTLPVHRLDLGAHDSADAPAVYVRAPGLEVERLEQRYTRLPGDAPGRRFDYACPRFGYEGRLVFDDAGFLLHYPGLATRVR